MSLNHIPQPTLSRQVRRRIMAGSIPGTNPRPGNPPKISVLLVDDEMTFLRIVSGFLETLFGRELEVLGSATGGEECLSMAQVLNPQVVLIDLSLPGSSALHVIPLLRIMFPETRIIALSADDGAFVRQDVLNAGANALISKKSLSSGLMPLIRQLMAQDPLEIEYVV